MLSTLSVGRFIVVTAGLAVLNLVILFLNNTYKDTEKECNTQYLAIHNYQQALGLILHWGGVEGKIFHDIMMTLAEAVESAYETELTEQIKKRKGQKSDIEEARRSVRYAVERFELSRDALRASLRSINYTDSGIWETVQEYLRERDNTQMTP